MSEITKIVVAAGLIAVGFFSASLLGTPKPSGIDGEANHPGLVPPRLSPVEVTPPLAQVPSISSAVTQDANFELAAHLDPPTHLPPSSGSQSGWPAPSGVTPLAFPEVQASPPGTTPAPGWDWNSPEATTTNDRRAALTPPSLLTASRAMGSPLPPPPRPIEPLEPRSESEMSPQLRFPEAPSMAEVNDHWRSSGLVAAPTPITPLPETTWHVVSDGDNLSELAQHYLQDPTRAAEIYDLNRDQLADPQLLPIGAKLRIPLRPPVPRAVQVYDAQGQPRPDPFLEQRQLVPLPAITPSLVATSPQATLQPPRPASFAGYGP